MTKQSQMQENHLKQIAEIQPQVNSENLLKVINLIETFRYEKWRGVADFRFR